MKYLTAIILLLLLNGKVFSQDTLKEKVLYDRGFYPETTLLRKDCQPELYDTIALKVRELDSLFRTLSISEKIDKKAKYRLLYSVQHYEALGKYDCCFQGNDTDVISGKEIFKLNNEIKAVSGATFSQTIPILYGNKYVRICGAYEFIGAINREYIMTYYFEKIE